MENKKFGVLIISALFTLLILASAVSAELEVTKEVVSSLAIPEINAPAIFDLSIRNMDHSDSFMIYAVSGIRIEPNDSLLISSGKINNITIRVYPTVPLKLSPDYYSFEYKIIGENTLAQAEELALILVKLGDAFDLSADDINPDSDSAIIHLKSKYGGNIDNLTIELSSELFSQSSTISLKAYEDKKIEIPLEKSKTAGLLAGPYIISTKISSGDAEASKNAVINFNEKEGISVSESKDGLIIRKLTIEKKNEGNTKTTVSIAVTKNLFSALFTSYNIPASKRDFSLLTVTSTFTKELSPNESLEIVATTNWWILVLVILAIGAIYYLIDQYVRNKVTLSKKAYFVRTKGGEFALKVSILVKARDFVERIKVMDRLPPMVKVFERYGLVMPDKIDEKNRRLEWNIQALGKGEVRELSYIIYSKIGVVGRFELPATEAFYEYMGKIKEASSNPVFYQAE